MGVYDFKDSLLDPEKDSGLIQNIHKYAQIAGLSGSPKYIWQSMQGLPEVSEKDIQRAKLIPNLYSKLNKAGMVFSEYNASEIPVKFMAMTGYMIRNYLDARYYPLPALVTEIMEEGAPEPRMLFIPDFVSDHSNSMNKKSIIAAPDWKKEMLYGLLLQRQADGLPTILAVPEIESILHCFGRTVYDFIQQYYASAKGAD